MKSINQQIKLYYRLFLLSILLFYQPSFAAETNKPPKPFEKYNVVLVFIDTLRADHLSCYGYPRKTSPNIDKLAKESAIFEENFTPITYTLPSFMSIITSIYPNSHGVLYIHKDKLSPRVVTLAQILKTYGYKTAWFGPLEDLQLLPEVGFGWGFDELTQSEDFRRNSDEYRRHLCDWLEVNKEQRFFLNFHTYKVHGPYISNPKYKAGFTKIKSMKGIIESSEECFYGSVRQVAKDKKLGIELMGEDLYNQFIAAGLSDGSNQQIDDFFTLRKKIDVLSRIRASAYFAGMKLQDSSVNAYVQSLYDAGILEYDAEVIGPVIEKLKALHIYDKTIIIICADHGEEFYEHGGFEHGKTLYDEVTHVPLIIRAPWIKQAKRIKELTQTVDILPTLLDLLKIPIPHQAQGKSLVGLMQNQKEPLPLYEYVFGRMSAISSVRSKEWLLIFNNDNPGHRELYNLYSDPGQQQNIYVQHKDVALKLESRLKDWEAWLPSYKDQEYSFPPEIDKTTQERIRKTGYW